MTLAKESKIVWWFLFGLTAFVGIKLTFNGLPLAFISIVLWFLISSIWEGYAQYLAPIMLKEREVKASIIFGAITMGVVLVLLSWLLSWLMSLTGYSHVGQMSLLWTGIPAGVGPTFVYALESKANIS